MQTERYELLVPGTKEHEVRAHLSKVPAGNSESAATFDSGLVARNHHVATPGWMQSSLMPALIEDPQIQASLRLIVARFTSNPVLQEDLMQESLFHLWRIAGDEPGHTKSWYL